MSWVTRLLDSLDGGDTTPAESLAMAYESRRDKSIEGQVAKEAANDWTAQWSEHDESHG